MTTTKRKITTLILSMIMALVLCIGLVPAFSMTAFAADGETTVTTLNFGQTKIIENGVLGNTTSGTGWRYDSTTNTIHITGYVEVTLNNNACIYAEGPLNINVAEGATLKATSNRAGNGAIGSTGDLSLSGDGTVEVTGSHNEGGNPFAVRSGGNIAISGVKLTANCDTGEAAIQTENGSLTINNAVVTANANCLVCFLATSPFLFLILLPLPSAYLG